jgi:tetratricopeptide (TPR) repeat protein
MGTKWLRAALLAAVGIELALLAAQQYAARRADSAEAPDAAAPAAPQDLDAVALAAFPDRVADAAGVLREFHDTLEWQTKGWRDDLGIDVHVATIRSQRKIEELADQIFQERRVGEGAPLGGLLVLVNPMRGEARIEVAYSLEHVFPDLIVGRIARDQLAPYAAYRISGMAVMDVLHLLKDYAYVQAVRGALPLPAEYREHAEFVEKQRYLSGGAGARATLEAALDLDRDFKAAVPAEKRARYAPSTDPLKSAEALWRAMRDQVGDPTLDLYTPGSQCMLAAYPYAPFEQLEHLQIAEASKPLHVSERGDRAVVDSERPAHGFVPVLLERSSGRWRVDLVETWKNLFFGQTGDYHQHNSNHPYAFALDRFGAGPHYAVAPWLLASGDLAATRRALADRGRALDEFLLAELLFRNCWLPTEAFTHYERAIALSPHNLLFHETQGARASYVGFWDLAVTSYAELGSAALLPLADAQRAAGDTDAAIASARRAIARDPFWIEAHELLGRLLEAKGDRAAARAEERRVAEIRSDPGRPGASLALAFDPPNPVLHGDAPTRVGDTDVYDHSYFGTTIANPSARDVEIESVILVSDGTADRSGLGDIKDYWRYPSGRHRLRAGESVRLERTWGFTVKTGNQQLRYAFDVCWKGDGGRQCRDYHVDLLPPVDAIGVADPEAVARARSPAVPDQKRGPPAIAARLELLDLLRNRRFDELTRRVEAAQAAFEADPGREEQVEQTWDTFLTEDSSVAPLLEAWAAAVPSYAPHVALGLHHRRSGWDARGPGSASNTSREQFAAMDAHFDQALQHLNRALEIHPRLTVALETLINIEKSGARVRAATPTDLVARAARTCPSCVYPPFERLIALYPRWGGSHEEMQRYLAELAPRIEKFARLAILRGAIAADDGESAMNRQDYDAALRFYDEALRHGAYWYYRRYRGQVLYRLGHYPEALADIEFWIAHGLRPSQALLWKVYTLGKLERYAEAAEAIDLARHLEPTDDEILRLAKYYGERR